MELREPARLLLSFLAGAVSVAAFAPTDWWWLVWPSLVIFFTLHSGLGPKAAFRLGFCWGLGFYLVGVSWVYVSLHVYGGMPLWMGAIAVAIFASVIALFVAAPSALAAGFAGDPTRSKYQVVRLLLLVCFWTVFEWAKSWVLTGFPWLDLGYSQTSSWLFALAPVGGVYLISFVILLSAAGMTFCLLAKNRTTAALRVLPALVLLMVSLFHLSNIEWSSPLGAPVQVGIVQPNTSITTKWQSEHRDRTVHKLADLSKQLATDRATPVELLIWPETALALYYQQLDDAFWRRMVPAGVNLLTGLVDQPDLEQTYNAAVLLCDGQTTRYRKRHLVPFGEYLPLRFLFNWVLEYLQLPMSDFSSWQEPQTLTCGSNLTIGLSICYEDAFGGEHRQFNPNATVLVNISEDAWFGDSLAPHQRLQMAQMRAYELARPMLRSGNSGPSAVIDRRGRLLKTTNQFEVATINHSIQPRTGSTLFARFGIWSVWLALLIALVAIAWQRRAQH